jgi:DNA primase
LSSHVHANIPVGLIGHIRMFIYADVNKDVHMYDSKRMAGYIPEDLVNDIRQQTDIVAVISEYVALQQSGRNYKGLCPFHQEKTPSFVVNPQKQIFHCYGCGVGGNVFTFLMRYEKYTFPEAVRILAERLGIQLPSSSDSKQTSQQRNHRDALYALHQEAARYFTRQLTNSRAGENTRRYLQQRGIGDEVIQEFSLGYALPAWDDLGNTLLGKSYPLPLLLESGLVLKRKRGVGQYDRFRDRLMIPIHDERGRIVAFGGRALGEGEPKYLNSPESPIFRKGRMLFGFHQAKDAIRRSGHILIVEGYFDMIVPYNLGIQNIVATMGTALTDQHLRLLQRYAKTAILIFDADPAGMKAMMRTLDLFLPSPIEARAVVLPEGDDPDSVVRRDGPEPLQDAVERAPLLLDFVRDRIMAQYDLSRIEQQVGCANHLLPTLVKIPNAIEREAQVHKTANLLGIDEAALRQELARSARTRKPRLTPPARQQKPTAVPVVEQYLIKALLKDKSLIVSVQKERHQAGYTLQLNHDTTAELSPADFSHPVTQRIMRELFAYQDQTDFEARVLDAFAESPYLDHVTTLFMQSDDIVNPAQTVRDCVAKIREKSFDRETLDITRKLKAAQERKNQDVLNAFLEQKNQDLQKKRKIFVNYKKNSHTP